MKKYSISFVIREIEIKTNEINHTPSNNKNKQQKKANQNR